VCTPRVVWTVGQQRLAARALDIVQPDAADRSRPETLVDCYTNVAEAKISAGDLSADVVESVVAHSSPLSLVVDLQSACSLTAHKS
jgi:hypothetical protein